MGVKEYVAKAKAAKAKIKENKPSDFWYEKVRKDTLFRDVYDNILTNIKAALSTPKRV